MSSRLGGFTSKSNKCHKDCFIKLSAEVLTKRISLNPNLDFSQITQTSQRGVGESSQRLENEYAS
jgi:transposase